LSSLLHTPPPPPPRQSSPPPSHTHKKTPHPIALKQLELKLPDGSVHTKPFKMGHTVAFVKLEVEKACGVAMEKQQLVLAAGGKPLLDILCLADYPQIKAGGVNTVLVSLAAA